MNKSEDHIAPLSYDESGLRECGGGISMSLWAPLPKKTMTGSASEYFTQTTHHSLEDDDRYDQRVMTAANDGTALR